MCDVWQLSDVVMCTSSIMHMCTISLDRYAAIRDPLHSRAARARPITFWAKITAVWLVSVVIGSPLIVVGVLSPGDLLSEDGQCAIVNAYYLVYGSLAAFFGPLTIMLVTFVLTVRLLEREATQLAADGNGGMRRCTADRKAHPPLTIVTRTAEVTAAASAGRRRRATGSSWMSRRSEAPTTSSMLPSPSKFPHETVLPNTTSGPDAGDVLHQAGSNTSRDTPHNTETDMKTQTVASSQRVTSSMTVCCDKLGSVEIGSCVVDVSSSAHAPQAAVNSTFGDVTNAGSASDCRVAAESGDVTRSPEAASTRDVTCVIAPSTRRITGTSDCCADELRNSTALVKSLSEFSSLRRPEVAYQRRSVVVTSLDSSFTMADRLRRVIVSLHPIHADSERLRLLKHSDDRRRYVAADDVIKLLPVELTDETRHACDQHPRASSIATGDAAMRRSRSDSAVGIQPAACSHRAAIQSCDTTASANNVDEGGPANNVIADTQRPVAADNTATAAKMAASGDAIVTDVDEDNGTRNTAEGEMTRSISGADKFKGLVRKHGAAFQVAGMLRATREDRQQKAFNSVKTESKAVKVLGTMFAIFVACWAPFFTANLMMGVCSSCYVDPLLFKVDQLRLSLGGG